MYMLAIWFPVEERQNRKEIIFKDIKTENFPELKAMALSYKFHNYYKPQEGYIKIT